jgi:hypothetical protein
MDKSSPRRDLFKLVSKTGQNAYFSGDKLVQCSVKCMLFEENQLKYKTTNSG